MALMKGLILEDEVKLSAIQRQFIRNFCAFIAAVYDKAYTHDHLDTIMYAYKSDKLVQLELVSETFMTTKDPNNEDHEILQELTEKLQGSRIKDGLLLDINYKMANEILSYLETEHFKTLLERIVKIQN
jgi:ribosome-associated toxin RatA of RatAB toxin-antitoxin module